MMRTKNLTLALLCLFFISCVGSALHNRKMMKQNYLKTHPEISSRMRDAILNGDILIGMTAEQVLASRGRPYKINRSTGSYGIHEQWVYVGIEINARMQVSRKETLLDHKYAYIYFENGIVTSWQSR